MADDKDIKYIMHYKEKKPLKADFFRTNLKQKIKISSIEGGLTRFSDINVIVKKKKDEHRIKEKSFRKYLRFRMSISRHQSRDNLKVKKSRSDLFLRQYENISNNMYTNALKNLNKSNNYLFDTKYYVNNFVAHSPFKSLRNSIIYRCQYKTKEETCCCSCNSDAMFEVMKSLYDCYKKKNCDNCNCILCGHLPREERRLGELRKSGAELASAGIGVKQKKKKLKKKSVPSIEDKTKADKRKTIVKEEKFLEKQAVIDVPPSEGKISKLTLPSEKMMKAKKEGLLTPLKGKSPEQKEKILRGLAMNGIPLPKGKSQSERHIIEKVRLELGLPPEPKTQDEKIKYKKGVAAGLIVPLEGKSQKEKEELLKQQANLGMTLPEGRSASEKAIINKIKETVEIDKTKLFAPSEVKSIPSEKISKLKAEGLLTPLKGKSPKQKEKIFRGLAINGIPLPKAKTDSERQIIEKVRQDLGLPPEPKTSEEKRNYKKAVAAGLVVPLEGKANSEKEKLLKEQAKIGIRLPEGRTTSEQAVIAKVKKISKPPSEMLASMKKKAIPSETINKLKAEGLLTPLKGKNPEQKEKVLRGWAINGIPLPKAKTDSERKIIEKVRQDLGLPPEPKTSEEKKNYKKAVAAGLVVPLEGKANSEKEKLLKEQAKLGIRLPVGRTASEKALITKLRESTKHPIDISVPSDLRVIPSTKIKKARAAGLLTPLNGKSTKQKEKILRGLALNGIPLPKAKTDSERKLITKIRKDLGLPPEPSTAAEKSKYKLAIATGLITPLEGKTLTQKQKLLQDQAKLGIPLPEGRTKSEKAFISQLRDRIKEKTEMKELVGKTNSEKERNLKTLAKQGFPLPSGKTTSEIELIAKVRDEIGLPPAPLTTTEKEKYEKAHAAGLITPLEGKSKSKIEKLLKEQAALGLTLPKGRSPSERELIQNIHETTKEKLDSIKKTNEEMEVAFKRLANQGNLLPDGKTKSEQKILDKVRYDLGLPPKPKSKEEKNKYNKAHAAGIIVPLEGKSESEKKNILQQQADFGLELPEARTASERELIKKVMKKTKKRLHYLQKLDTKTAKIMREGKGPSDKCICDLLTPEADKIVKDFKKEEVTKIPTEKLKIAKETGLLTPLRGKSPEQKEKIIKGMAMQGIPFPQAETTSENDLINKVIREIGLPPKPKSSKIRKNYEFAQLAGIITPLEGKTKSERKIILTKQAELGIPLPEGRTQSEKDLINRINTTVPKRITSETIRKAISAGIFTPITGKPAKEKDRILRTLAAEGLPLPVGKTASEKKLIRKIESEMGVTALYIPPEKQRKAKAAGLLTPLKGKTKTQKEEIVKGLALLGIPLPKAQTSSEKKIIDKVRKDVGLPPEPKSSSLKEKYKYAQEAGFLTPLEGKSAAQKKKILTKQAQLGIPLPEARTQSEKDLIKTIQATVPKTVTSEKLRTVKAAGLLTPLTGKPPKEQERILRNLAAEGLPLPEGRTASEKQIIQNIKDESGIAAVPIPSEKLRKAKAEGLLTPLKGKTDPQREKIVRGLAMLGMPIPKAQTASEKNVIDKVRVDLGLPPEPETASLRDKYKYAQDIGILTPLEGKTAAQKKNILTKQAEMGIPLAEGRTQSEKDLINKIRATVPKKVTSDKFRKAMAAGLLTPITGKPLKEKERILRNLATEGMPLPEGKTASEIKLIRKIESEMGITAAPIPSSKLRKAKAAGLLTPLRGKSDPQKEKIVRELAMIGIPLPKAQTASEKKIIDKVRKDVGLPPEPKSSSLKEKYKYAQEAGFLTPLEGKSAAQKKKILTKQAQLGIPLPEARTQSEKDLIKTIQATVPKTVTSEKLRTVKAAGLLTPLTGKPPKEQERILKNLAAEGLPLPEGRTASEKQIIQNIKDESGIAAVPIPSEKLRKAKAEGLLTPLKGKTDPQREKIVRGLAMLGMPIPKAQTASEKNIIDKVRVDLGLPPEPETASLRDKYKYAQDIGILTPLEGKTAAQKKNILTKQAEMGIPLAEGRTQSEKDLINKIRATVPKKVTSDKFRKAMAAGLLTPITGKPLKERERILRNLATEGMPLPKGKTASETKLIRKIESDMGITAAPIPSSKLRKAKAAGLLTPLKGKSEPQKEKIVRELAMIGIPLPKAQTASEKKIIDKVRKDVGLPPEPKSSSLKEKYKYAQEAGFLTPLEGKSAAQKKKILTKQAQLGIPLPEARSQSEKDLIKTIQATVPKTVTSEKLRTVKAAGLLTPLTGKPPKEQERILRNLAAEGLPLPEGRTASEKQIIQNIKDESGIAAVPIPSEKLRKAKAEGLLTPLKGKTDPQREKIVRGLAMLGMPIPKAQTASEKNIIDKVRVDLGLPPEPETASLRDKYKYAQDIGILTPLEGKTAAQKKNILTKQAEMGIPLAEGRTQSEKDLINKIRATVPKKVTSDKFRKAMAAGLLTPITGKPLKEKERILRNLATEGMPLPEGKTASEIKLIRKIESEMGITAAPIPSSKLRKAKAAGLLTPLRGKSDPQKEKIVRELAMIGIPLPKAQTASEKKIIDKVRKDVGLPPEPKSSSLKEKYKYAQEAGFLTPLEGKSAAQKKKILTKQAQLGIPLPEARTQSEKDLIKTIQATVPKTVTSEKLRTVKAAGLLTPLTGKPPKEQERILKNLAAEGLPLPEGRTASEKQIIQNIKDESGIAAVPIPSEKLRKAKAEGLLTPLKGKTDPQREKIVRGLAMLGMPIPKAQTASEKNIIDKVRVDLGLPPEPETASLRDKYKYAQDIGILTPLEGKTAAQKKNILTKQAEMGIPLAEGRTQSEKDLINKIRATVPKKVTSDKFRKAMAAGLLTPITGKPLKERERILRNLATEGMPLPEGKTASETKLIRKIESEMGITAAPIPSSKLRKAKAAGLLTPLKGKSEPQKEKIVRELAMIGIPLPKAQTASEKKIIDKVRKDVGLPPEPKSSSLKEKYKYAQEAGFLTPLEGKSAAQKKKILTKQAQLGIPLPEARSQSEKDLIKTIQATVPKTVTSEKLRTVKAAGLLTPLTGKPPKEQERILKNLAAEGLPLPEGRTASEKQIIQNIKDESGIAAVPIPSEKLRKAKAEGLLTPLKGKTDPQREKIVRGLAMLGMPIPKAQTASEKNIIDKVRVDLGLPPEPETASLRDKYKYAQDIGILTPLEGKTAAQKKNILTKQAEMGIPLAEGRTQSEKDLINKIRATVPKKVTSDKFRKAMAAGLLTPITGKPLQEKERILRNLATEGMPLPEGKTASEIKLIRKIESEMGTTAAPIPSSKLRKAKAAGLLTPLRGKSDPQKEKIVRDLAMLGIPLPKPQTASEKNIIDKVRKDVGLPPEPKSSSLKEKHKYAQEAGFLTPLEGKSAAQKKKILTKQAQLGIPLPEARTQTEKDLIKTIQATVPKAVTSEKLRTVKAAGLLTPLTGKPPKEQERILRNLAAEGLPLPEGKTASEKQLIRKIESEIGITAAPIPSEKLRKAKAAGILTPLKGKTNPEKEKIVRELALHGIPLPRAQTPSEKKIIDKVRKDVGLPPEPVTSSLRDKYRYAQETGILTPLEGKTTLQKKKILTKQAQLGIPLPEGRTLSEKDLIKKIQATVPKIVTSEKLRNIKAAGLLTPIGGKPTKEKEKILRHLAHEGLPLPDGKTLSEKQIIHKIKSELGLTTSMIPSEKLRKAMAAGLLTPLKGKSDPEKEKILRELVLHGIPLPTAQTASENKMIDKVRRDLGLPPEPQTSSLRSKYKYAQEAGLLTPLEGKTADQKKSILTKQARLGIPLPDGRTKSEQDLIKKIQATVPKNVTSEKLRKVKAAGLLTPLTGKSQKEKERILRNLAAEGIPLPEGKSASEKLLIQKIKSEIRSIPIPSEKLRKARAAGLLTPLEGKTRLQQENIIKELALLGMPLPKAQSNSEKKIIDKVRKDLGLPPEPKSSSIRDKYINAQAAGIITPLQGKTATQKEKILTKLAEIGIPLPEGRTKSEKELIKKIEATKPTKIISDKLRKAKASGLLKPVSGKLDESDRLLRTLAAEGLPLPKGKSTSQKELSIPSDKLIKAKAAGLLTPLKGKSDAEKENIVRQLALLGIPLPKAQSASEKRVIDNVRKDLGLPPEPTTSLIKEKYRQAQKEGIITTLEGKSKAQKEQILKKQADIGIPLPEGRTQSEKDLINKLRREQVTASKLRKARAAGLLSPLEGKPSKEKEKILRNLAKSGLPLPEGGTPSEKRLIQRIRKEMGVPLKGYPSEKLRKALAEGLITPLEGKTAAQKEMILRGRVAADLPLPETMTPSEKELVERIRVSKKPESKIVTSEKEKMLTNLAMLGKPLPEAKTTSESKLINKIRQNLGIPPEPKTKRERQNYRKAYAEGIIQPLEGKTLAQKAKILEAEADMGLELPEGRSSSEKSLIQKIKSKREKGTPKLPEKLKRLDIKSAKYMKEGKGPSDECICDLLTPVKDKSEKLLPEKFELLQGKPDDEKEKIIRELALLGKPLPEPQSASEKKIIDKVLKEVGLIAPLEGKTSLEKEKILTKQGEMGIPSLEARTQSTKVQKTKDAGTMSPLAPLEGKTRSEKSLLKKVKVQVGLPPEPSSQKRVKSKSKKIGITKSKKSETQIGVGKSKFGVVEELQDITKTTTCDRACGCDRKKIRFKHSYVKIRVTSPDISSLCPCPDECVPGVKGGVFTDNEGIKVTVGQATVTPSFRSTELDNVDDEISLKVNSTFNLENNALTSSMNHNRIKIVDLKWSMSFPLPGKYLSNNIDISSSSSKHSISCNYIESKESDTRTNDLFFPIKLPLEVNNSNTMFYFGTTNSSISLKTTSSFRSSETFSVISFSITDISSNTSCMSEKLLEDLLDYLTCKKKNIEHLADECYADSTYSELTTQALDALSSESMRGNRFISTSALNLRDICRKNGIPRRSKSQEISKMWGKNMSNSDVTVPTSSCYVVLSTSSTDYSSTYCLPCKLSSTICIQISEDQYTWKYNYEMDFCNTSRPSHSDSVISSKTKNYNMKKIIELEKIIHKNRIQAENIGNQIKNAINVNMYQKCNKYYEMGTDTTQDRPCCCNTNKQKNLGFNQQPFRNNFNEPKWKSNISPQRSCSDCNNKKNKISPLIIPYCLNDATQNKSCQCDFEKIKDMIENVCKKIVSTGCGSGPVNFSERGCIKPIIKKTQWSPQVSTSKQYPAKKYYCTCSTSSITESEKLLNSYEPVREIPRAGKCPCEESTSVKQNEDSKYDLKRKSKGKDKKKKKKVTCLCPPAEPEDDFDPIIWVDDKRIRKFKSAMTQSITGFKFDINRKVQNNEMSLDDAMKLLANDYGNYNKWNINDKMCSCASSMDKLERKNNYKKKINNVTCTCPPSPIADEQLPPKAPFRGFKLHMGGKGSSSKGLSGVLCF
ncbi:uncharacterized protein LOC126978330 isoform X2 [Leptidea sinapis]|uniref:uncharacterized protein LOC126978330 isoform X2 n=1 Tax=Leptidea sinapis TaxID=189913 RepID=UPI0021C40C5D|nr:uncharacterized protein LOC126978330 isoform X2 [Leptidea sinapis]